MITAGLSILRSAALTAVLSASVAGAASAAGPASAVTVTQITHGPSHHYFGYLGQSRTIPWSADGRYLLALQVPFQDRMPGPENPDGFAHSPRPRRDPRQSVHSTSFDP